MARPRYEGKIYRYRLTLCLREGEHDDLIPILEDAGEGDRAQTVITAMRRGVAVTAVDSDIDEGEAAEALFDLMM